MKNLLKVVCVNCGLIKCLSTTGQEVWAEPWINKHGDYTVTKTSTYFKTSEKEICPECYNNLTERS
jgi:hypothetical protein